MCTCFARLSSLLGRTRFAFPAQKIIGDSATGTHRSPGMGLRSESSCIFTLAQRPLLSHLPWLWWSDLVLYHIILWNSKHCISSASQKHSLLLVCECDWHSKYFLDNLIAIDLLQIQLPCLTNKMQKCAQSGPNPGVNVSFNELRTLWIFWNGTYDSINGWQYMLCRAGQIRSIETGFQWQICVFL